MSLIIRNAAIWQWYDGEGNKAGRPVSGFNITVNQYGRIKLFRSEEPIPDEGSYSACIDGTGLVALPGLHDAHIHVMGTGRSVNFLDLKGCYSIEELRDALRRHLAVHPELTWIIGVNWDQVR
jgi:predicted amidohydrolase YtcJ